MAQERFWKELHQLKFHISYIEILVCDAEKYDRSIKIFMAISSAASIGAWVVWKDLSFIWACIIALSQVISAISPHLPFKERLQHYSSALHELEELFIQAESKWHDISSGKCDEDSINKERTSIQEQKRRLLKKNLPSSVFPSDEKMELKAENLALSYFSNFYPPEEFK